VVHPQAPAQFVWISAQRAQHIRGRCALVGVPLLIASLVLGVLIVVLGGQIPSSHPFRFGAVVFGAVSDLFLFFAAIGLVGSRPYVPGEHLNLTGARTARRVLIAMWVGSVFASAIACLVLSKVVSSSGGSTSRPQLDFSGSILVYLLLLITPAVLAGIAAIVGYRLFKAPR